MKTVASTKLDTISSHVSKALMDDFVSDEEFKLIMEELEKYKAMKEEIRNNTKKKLKEEEKETLIERGRQEARESFRRLVEKKPWRTYAVLKHQNIMLVFLALFLTIKIVLKNYDRNNKRCHF